MYDLIDENDTPLGVTADYATVYTEGLRHRGVNVVLYTKDKRVVVQRRALTMDLFPDTYEISVGGGVNAGEEPVDAACREILEELNIVVDPDELDFIGNSTFQYQKGIYNANIVMYCYKAQISDAKDFVLSIESQSAQLIPLEELERAVENGGVGEFGTLWPREELNRLLLSSLVE